MKDVVLKRNSWHRWLALRSDNFSTWETDADICRYTKCVLSGLLKTALMVAVLTVIVGVMATVVAAVVSGLYYAIFSPLTLNELLASTGWTGFSMMMFAIALAASLIGGLLYCLHQLTFIVRARARRADRPAGFIRTALRPLKEKVCFKVRFTEEE